MTQGNFLFLLVGAQILSASLALASAIVARLQKKRPGSLPLAILMLAVSLWNLSAMLKNILGREQMPFWAAAEIYGMGIAANFFLLFILEYTRQQTVNRHITELAFTLPIVFALLAGGIPQPPAQPFSPPLFYPLFTFYFYTLRLLSTGLLAWGILKSSNISRPQLWILTLGASLPWAGNLLIFLHPPLGSWGVREFELHAFAYTLSGLVLGFGILQFRLLEVVPLAKDHIIESLQDPFFILDENQNLIEMNLPAQALLGVSRKKTFGLPIASVIEHHPNLLGFLQDESQAIIQFHAPSQQFYEGKSVPLQSGSKQRGRLILLKDISRQKQSEKEILEQQRNLQTLLEAAPYPLSITRVSDGKILYANEIALDLYELDPRNYREWSAPQLYEAPEQREEILQRLQEQGRVENLEMRMHSSAGKKRWVLSSIRPIRYEEEDCLLTAQVDISDRKEMEDELRQGRERLKAIFDYAGLGIRVTAVDGSYTFVNEQWAEMLATPSQALLGQNELDFLHPNHKHYNREVLDAIRSGELANYHIENRYLRADGSAFWGELTMTPIYTPDGQIESVIGFVMDITQRKNAETNLREAERRFREILENLQLFAVMLDVEGNITFYNHHLSEVTGWERSEVLSKNWFRLFLPENLTAQQDYTRAIQRGNIFSRHENQICLRDGARRLVSWNNTLLKDENGRPIGMASIGEDITERRLMQTAEREQRIMAESLTDTAQALSSLLDFNDTIDIILENASKVVPHDSANISLITKGKVHFIRARSNVGMEEANQTIEQITFDLKTTYNMRQMYETKEPILVTDTHEYPQWVKDPETDWIRSYLGVPIIIQNKVVGFLSLNSVTPNFFTPKHTRSLQAFSLQAAIAIENARLYQKSQKEIDERRKAQTRLRRANKRLENQLAKIENLQAQLREQAIRDGLTGLYNRRYLEETIQREVARARRENISVSVIMLDIDHFKNVNDTYGHEAGDKVLQSVANILLADSRRADAACRYGGEEFCVIFPGAPLSIAQQRAEEWREVIAKMTVTFKSQRLKVTVSMGVACYPEHGQDPLEIIGAADRALYTAKPPGRNRFVTALPQSDI